MLLVVAALHAGNYPKIVIAYRGTMPTLDGILSPGEWDDADSFAHDATWNSDAGTVKDPSDYCMTAWVKHDGADLCFAFDVSDDVIYGRDIPAWLPDGNPHAHELTPSGWPWFADGIEIFLNPEHHWSSSKKDTQGDGTSWKIVCSSFKSRLGGVGVPGLLEGEPRTKPSAWNNYQRWILDGRQQAVVRIKEPGEGSGFVIEWKISADPCLEVTPGKFWSPALGSVDMGMNVEIQDLDGKAAGAANWSNFRHIDYWAAEKGKKELLERWGVLRLVPERKPQSKVEMDASRLPDGFRLLSNYPNPFNGATTIPFKVPKAEQIRIEMLNLQGAAVKMLFDGRTESGERTVIWHGDDQLGRPLPSGVYVCRMKGEDGCSYRRVLMIK